MPIPTKPIIISLALLTAGSSLADINTSNSVSIKEVAKEDESYNQLLTEIVEASPSSVKLLNLSTSDFSSIEVRKEVTRIVEGKMTAAFELKSYSTCASDKTHGFSYNVEATWSSDQELSGHQASQWKLASYKAKRRNQPCNA